MRLELTAGSVALVLLAIAAAVLAAEVLVSARRVISWIVACAVAAALIELVVQYLDRWMKRAFAIVLVLLAIGGIAGVLALGVFQDLDVEIRRLQNDVPAAAAQVQRSERVGRLATEVELERRVTAAVDRLRSPASGLAGEAVSSAGTYTVCAVLTILFLSWGPKVASAAVEQLERGPADRVRTITRHAFRRARRYVVLALLQSVVVGFVGWVVCELVDIPAPAPLALALAAFALVPNIGVLVGALPILLLSAGLSTTGTAITVAATFFALQALSTLVVQRRIVRASGLYVGPAVVVIANLVGFELYGIGGALYGAAIAVFGVAAIDTTTEIGPVTTS